MLVLVLRKMASNRWLVLTLFGASVLSVALLASIPIYTDGVLQRLLTRDLELHQERTGRYPGTVVAAYNIYRLVDQPERKAPFHDALEQTIQRELVPGLQVPVAASMKRLTMDYLYDERPATSESSRLQINKVFSRVEAIRDLEAHIDISNGRTFAPEPVDGVYEAIVTREALIEMQLLLGRTYELNDLLAEEPRLAVRVVGVFTKNDPRDLFWFQRFNSLSESFLIDYDTFTRDFLYEPARNLTYGRWHYALDYHQITLQNVPNLLRRYDQYVRAAAEQRVELDFPVASILEEYNKRAATLKITLAFLHVPIVLILVFFIYMVSQLIVEGDLAEIAVLESRGAATRQLFVVYLLQSLLISGGALLVGPFVALVIVRFLGAANGFLELVGRSALTAQVSQRAFLFALLGAGIFLAATLLPATGAARTSIVQLRGDARTRRYTFWRRYLLDVLLIGVSIYGLVQFQQRREVLIITAAEGGELPLDPLLFLTSVVFILGSGLLLLRVFPWLVNVLFRLGRRYWPPAAYAAFIQVSRSKGHEQFLMVFLILALAFGIYNSSAARTINRSVEERILYTAGADLTLKPYFPNDAPDSGGADDLLGGPPTGFQAAIQYREPPYEPFTQLPGLAATTRVLRQDRASLSLPGNKRTQTAMIAITPDEFGRVAWFRPDLLPAHWYHYLNLLTDSPKAMLLSQTIADEFDVELGDTVLLTWSGQDVLDGVVYGFVDFWPAYVPVGTRRNPRLVVANFGYIRAKMAVEPYEIWAKKLPDATSADIYTAIDERELDVVELNDATLEVIAAKNDPLLQGTNGVLTLGFLIAMGISLVGFAIYGVLTLRARTLQFGVLRAIGVPTQGVLAMLILEQLMITGAAILFGVIIGRVAGMLFVPLLQLVYSAADQVPPFRVVALRSDFLRVYAFAAALLVLGAVLFRGMLGRLRIHQALKLGEE